MEGIRRVLLLVFITDLLGSDVLIMAMRLTVGNNRGAPPPAKGLVVIGDMGMSEEFYRYLTAPPETTRKIIGPPEYRWPEESGFPTVPYILNSNVMKFANEILAGIDHWQENTCIKFRPKRAGDISYVEFINSEGCWSYVGRVNATQKQDISIGDGCQSLGTVVHEIGHAIGFIHEQMRSDRDSFLHINYDNIENGRENQFVKASAAFYINYSVEYDYTSVMQYGGMDFSGNGRLTMATKMVQHQGLLGRGQVLSHRDKQVANIHYQCIEKWEKECSLTGSSCQNGGYTSRDCKCVCPPGTSGSQCQQTSGSYYDDHLPSCSQVITKETELTSPNYPSTLKRDTWCVYQIQAPVGQVVQVRFLDFKLNGRYFGKCFGAYLEIRDDDMYDGTIACGNEVNYNQTFVSKSSNMTLYLDIPYGTSSKGFEAVVKFFDEINAPEPEKGIAQGLTASLSLIFTLLTLLQGFSVIYK